MVRQTTQDRTYSGIKIMICNILFLYSKERQFIMTGSRLQETQPGYKQDAITSNRKGNRQIKGSKIF